MAEKTEFGFFFEEQGLSGNEGPIDPAQQYFEGSHADHAVVRETGQNTLDNRGKNSSGPIRMVFELKEMATDDIPGIGELRKRLNAVADQTQSQQGHQRMVRAAALASEKTLQVLRISDYNTTGLTGSESLDADDTALSKLTRGKGGSSDDERGGSFGIGSAVGPMASELCTVFYTSVPEDGRESVLAGYTRLATHTLDDTRYRAEGHFTNRQRVDDFEYQRPAPVFGPFEQRTENGTDIFILGYRLAESDPALEGVRDAFVDNFMVAIEKGRLVVEGRSDGNNWILNSETLRNFARRRPEADAFLQALSDPDPIEEDIPTVGKVRLYVNVDDRLEKKLNTITMRKELMKIDTFRNTSISAKYAAILICDSEEGNRYLRKLEPPQHHEWDGAREPEAGKRVVKSLKVFVRDALKRKVGLESGDEVKIEGLARFLPTDTPDESARGPAGAPSSSAEAKNAANETSTVQGQRGSASPRVAKTAKVVRVKPQKRAVSGEGYPSLTGKERGGGGKRKTEKKSIPGTAQQGDGGSRIRGDEITFRSWALESHEAQGANIAIAVLSNKDQVGDLQLTGLGPGGHPERGYELLISRAALVLGDEEKEIKCVGNTIKGLNLAKGQLTRVNLRVPAGERYRLGVD